ncbi:hypothetical protein G4W71_06840 [Clostridium botulinum]|uniref:hypothetical protein n=1 Tax=Clostridium botulinum TaxID=1491 RepID=UPI001360B06D|nr:hypothetical protein [Clostridium botulinum]MBE1303744.1 hypothetical protein [Clostridium botulinum]
MKKKLLLKEAKKEDSQSMIDFYNLVGGEAEGILKKDNYINGIYYNTLMMSLII